VNTDVSKAPAATIIRVKVNEVGMRADEIERNKAWDKITDSFREVGGTSYPLNVDTYLQNKTPQSKGMNPFLLELLKGPWTMIKLLTAT
jgi:hypothetical protein